MPRSFKPLHPLRGWRRVATQAWRPPEDPSVYAQLDIPMRSALAYVERLREESGVRVTVTHLVARGVALALRQYPQLNGIVARGRIMLRDSVDIFLQVAIEGGTELSGIKIARADVKSVLEIAREMETRVERLRARQDRQVERTKSLLDRIPLLLLGPVMRTIAYLVYDLDLDLTRLGVVKDEFGSAMVTNVGMFGLAQAYAPHAPRRAGGRGAGEAGRGGGPGGGAADDDPRRHLRPPLHGRLARRGDGPALPRLPGRPRALRRTQGRSGRGRYSHPAKLSCRPVRAPSRR